jgi:hypothetical protein
MICYALQRFMVWVANLVYVLQKEYAQFFTDEVAHEKRTKTLTTF